MINYRFETQKNEDDSWSVKIYASGDLLNMYINCISFKEACEIGQAFIGGIKFARGKS